MFSTGLLHFYFKNFFYVLLSLVIKIKNKNFSFISSFDGTILDKSYNLKYFYKRIVFFLLFNAKVHAEILKITQIKKFYLNYSVLYFTKFFVS